MIKAYRYLALTICALVGVQAAAMAWGAAGESHFINNGGVIDKALVESAQQGGEAPFPEVLGFAVHAINGGMLIPLVALILLVLSFPARVPGGRRAALIVLVLIGAQIMLGYSIADIPGLGILHGFNALLLFTAALYAAHLARESRTLQHVRPTPEGTRV